VTAGLWRPFSCLKTLETIIVAELLALVGEV